MQDMIIYRHIYLLSSTVLNAVAAGLLVLPRLDRSRGTLNLEIQYNTCQMSSAAQPEACYRCDGLERGTELQKQALGGDSPTVGLGIHAPLTKKEQAGDIFGGVYCEN